MAYTSVNPDMESEVLRYGYQSMTTPPSTYDFNMRTREQTLLKQQPVLGAFTPGRLPQRAGLFGIAATAPGPPQHRLPQGHPAGRQRAPAALRLRQLRPQHGPQLQHHPPEPPEPRHDLRDRPHPGGRGNGPPVVRGRKAAEEDEHLLRLHRCRRVAHQAAVHPPGGSLRHGRERGWIADGRRGEPASRSLRRHRLPGTLRGCGDDHARRLHSPHHRRVRRVG